MCPTFYLFSASIFHKYSVKVVYILFYNLNIWANEFTFFFIALCKNHEIKCFKKLLLLLQKDQCYLV